MTSKFQDSETHPSQSPRSVEPWLFAAAVESAADGILITDAGGTIQYVNSSFTAMTGYTSEEAVGLNPRILKSGWHREAFYKRMWDAILSEGVWRGELTNRRKDGTLYEEESRVSCLRDSNGAVAGFIAVMRDITERKRLDRELCENEERFRGIFNHAPAGMCVTGWDGRFIHVNDSLCQMLGYSAEELLRISWMEIAHPDDLNSSLKKMERLLVEPGSLIVDEFRNIDRLGNVLWVRARISLVRDAGGSPRFFVSHIEDVTESRLAAQAMRESEERFRTMADSSPSMMWVTDAGGEIEFINRTYREFSNITCEAARTGKWRSLLHPDDAPEYLSKYHDAIERHASFSAEARVQRADGEWRLMGTRAEPRFSPAGEYMGHIGLRADITERERVNQEREFQHSLINAIYEGSLDGILIVNADRSIASHNRKLLEVWKIPFPAGEKGPMADSAGVNDPSLLFAILQRVKDPEIYLKRIQEVDNNRDLTERDEIELKDGRTLERYSTSLWGENGRYLGRARFFRDITERKQAEQTLLESENRFRIMADSCPIGIWVTDAEGRTRFINKTYRHFCGVASEQVESGRWELLLDQNHEPAYIEAFDRALAVHTSFKIEERSRCSDGEWRWVESYAEPRFSTDGEFLGLVGTARDISERKRAEQDLLNSEERFRQLAENIREVFWLKAPGTDDFLYVSPAYEQIWGRSCESFYKNPASRLEAVHPDDLEKARSIFTRQMNGETVDSEYRIATPEGHQKWIRSRAFPIYDSLGKLTRVAGIVEDVTERKLREEELIRAREQAEAANRLLSNEHAILDNERKILRTIIDNVPDFMYVKDTESRFVVANAALARWVGVKTTEELVGKTASDFFSPEVAGSFFEDDRRVVQSGQIMDDREETIGLSADNETCYLLTTKAPIFDSEGHVTGIAGIGRNITARKKNENELRESNLRLRVATDRANELALEAEAANRAKSEFLANMSHEIRTPMNGVLGMNGLLLGSNLDREQRHCAEVVDACAKSLLTVIDDILDFSKVEAGKLEIDTLDFNLRILMDEFAEMMAERVDEKQLEFVCAVAPDVYAPLQGDPGRLRQILMNLTANAIKFTLQGEVVVRVGMVSETDTEVSLRFSVRDTGIGIPAGKQQMLFNSFTQVDASTTRKYGGTGLGLAISKQLVELMSGTIGLESKEGQGSEFWFTIRLAKQRTTVRPDVPSVPVQGTRILVVDDNATNREVFTAQLQSWGAVVAAVESGSTALACLRYAVAANSPFQLALVDMMMPGMDGATLGRAILADQALKATPLVLMTSMGQRGDAHLFKEIGFAAYLIKPVRQTDLYECLVAVLTGESQRETRPLITSHSLRESRRGNARVLLVEDNLTNQEVAKGILRRLGWSADVAGDGKQAVHALETENYDVVLMDVQMPEMDGYEATRLIRNPESRVLNHDIPVIALTAHAMVGDAEKCLAAGMSDYISKPIDPATLAKTVEKWLTRKVHGALNDTPAETSANLTLPLKNLPGGSLVFNREMFLQRMMGDEGFCREVAAQFLEELPAILNDLKTQLELGDSVGIGKQAHKMKGSAANVGGEALRDVALEVEQAAKAGDLAAAADKILELETQSAQLIEVLRLWVN